MNDNVVNFPGADERRQTVTAAVESLFGHFEHVLVVGHLDDGTFVMDGSAMTGPEVLWLIERARHHLMAATDDIESE